MKTALKLSILFSALLSFFLANAQEGYTPKVSLGTHFFINCDYQTYKPNQSQTANYPYSKFYIRRGYFNIKIKLLPKLTLRWTPDIFITDTPFIRIKYLYAKFDLGKFNIFNNIHLYVGQIPRPWIHFEETVYDYKVVNDVFVENSKIINSADRGISIAALLGPKLDSNSLAKIHGTAGGKYGSIELGFYNGGGYMVEERNSNKTFEYRLTIRPLPKTIPQVTFSTFGALGYGNFSETLLRNAKSVSNFLLLGNYISYASSKLVLTAQYVIGQGNQATNFYQIVYTPFTLEYDIKALAFNGFSIYSNVNMFKNINLFVRYDKLNLEKTRFHNILALGTSFKLNRYVALVFRISDDFSNSNLKTFTTALNIKY